MSDLIDSCFEIKHGSTTILAAGTDDPCLGSWPKLSGGQKVQVDDLVDGPGQVVTPRGNEGWVIDLDLKWEGADAGQAYDLVLAYVANLPHTRADLTFNTFQTDGTPRHSYKFAGAVIHAFPADPEQSIGSLRLQITTGALSVIS